MHSNLLLLWSINHSQHWLLQWQDKNTSLPAAPAPGLRAAISSAWRQAWTLPAGVPVESEKIQQRVAANPEASREVFNAFLITFRDAQMKWRFKSCKKGQLGAVKMRRYWLRGTKRTVFVVSDLQKVVVGKGARFSAVLVYPGGCGLRQCCAALPSHHHCGSLILRVTQTVFPRAFSFQGDIWIKGPPSSWLSAHDKTELC